MELVGYDDGRPGNAVGFLVGRAFEVNYTDVPSGSNKAGSLWVHKTSKKHPTYHVSLPLSGTIATIGDMPERGVLDWLTESHERRGGVAK
jgi:hypothetical protein